MNQKLRKKWIIIGIILLLILVGIISYFLIQKERKEDAQAVTLLENRNIPFGAEAYVSDFIQEIKGTIIDNERIDTTTLGEKKVTIHYRNEKKRKKKRMYTVNVVDEVAPIVMLGNSYTVKVGYQKELENGIFSGDECDDQPTRKIEGEYNLNEIGSYPLTFVITDSSGNESRKNFTLNVVENTKKETQMKEKDKKAIAEVIENYKTANTKIGIDVSKWQEEIDWQAVKDSGVEFAMLRIGYQDGKNGENVVDPYFYQNIEKAKQLGIPVGVYFFSYAKTKEEAEQQADWVKEKLGDTPLELPVVFDWENWTSFAQFGISFYHLNEIAETFLSKIEAYGYTPSLYSSKTYLEKIWKNTKYQTWLAHYTDETNYKGAYSMWQICETGSVNGIKGDVDIDILYHK